MFVWPDVMREKMAHLCMKAWKKPQVEKEGKTHISSGSFNRKSFATNSKAAIEVVRGKLESQSKKKM